jgi:hypothetical protein
MVSHSRETSQCQGTHHVGLVPNRLTLDLLARYRMQPRVEVRVIVNVNDYGFKQNILGHVSVRASARTS